MVRDTSNRITIANIVAVIGIVLLAAALFLGYFYAGDNMGVSIMKGAAWALGFTFLLWFMIKAKGTQNEIKKWRIVEIAVLVVYLALAVLSSGVISKFFSIYASSGELKEAAAEDIEKIRNDIQLFKDDATTAKDETVRSMTTAMGQDLSQELTDFLLSHRLTLNTTSIDNFDADWTSDIESINLSGYNYDEVWKEELDRCDEKIQGWSVLSVPKAVATLKDLSEQIASTLSEMSETLPFPTITLSEAGIWEITGQYEAKTYESDLNVDSKLQAIRTYTPVGIAACVIIHLLILFNYFVAFRTDKIRPTRRKEGDKPADGILLNG